MQWKNSWIRRASCPGREIPCPFKSLSHHQAGEPVAPKKEAIVIHHVEGSGCYGHNGADDVAFDAVLLALRCKGQPVRVLWSRADELTIRCEPHFSRNARIALPALACGASIRYRVRPEIPHHTLAVGGLGDGDDGPGLNCQRYPRTMPRVPSSPALGSRERAAAHGDLWLQVSKNRVEESTSTHPRFAGS